VLSGGDLWPGYPGGALNDPTITGGYSPVCVFLHPGVGDNYKPGFSHTLGTLWGIDSENFQGDNGAAQQRQVFDKYLDYAILASGSDSIGDFQFDIQVMVPIRWIAIYVPPDFTWLAPSIEESVWTDITNDYQYIWSQTMSSYDPIAPNWTRILIGVDEWYGGYMNIVPGIYHVRFFHVSAPTVAGLYHFKIYTGQAGDPFTYIGTSIGSENYPFTIVKTELNPAWVQVTVRAHLNFAPPYISGVVNAEGTTPEGRAVKGVAYWAGVNHVAPQIADFLMMSYTPGEEGAIYRTWLFGLAAGTYTVTVQGSGYLPTTTERFTLDPGQSYSIFVVIYDSPDVCLKIWSKHGTGAIPWANLWQPPFGTNNPDLPPSLLLPWRDIMVDLYDSEGNLVGFWASNVFGPISPFAPLHNAAPKWIPVPNLLAGLHDDLAPHPIETSYNVCLQDNVDPMWTGALRLYPSTVWDGHIPWDWADYVHGYANGQYTVEAFVTGYIMDQPDLYQWQFTVTGTALSLQMDLRRSNWIEVTMYPPSGVWPVGGSSDPIDGTGVPPWTTVTLTASDVNGNERVAADFGVFGGAVGGDIFGDGFINGAEAVAWFCNEAWGIAPGGACPVPFYTGGIILEGWNSIFPNIGGTAFRGTSGARDTSRKDYGINPTASSHTAGTVELAGNPYTISLYMADMGTPYSANTDNNPDWLGTGWYQIVGGDPQVSVFLCNSRVPLSFKIVNAWIWISLRSVDFEVPAHSRPWTFPGSEIWVHFVDTATGEVADTLDPTLFGLIQDPGIAVSADPPRDPADPLGGFEIPGQVYPGHDGSKGLTPYDVDNQNDAGYHEHLGVRYTGLDWCSPTWNGWAAIHRCLLPALRSTRLPAGEYTYEAWTHGYVMRRSFPFQIPFANHADIEADMIQGGQVRVTMNFKNENMLTNFWGYIRVEVFNQNDELVGASIYGQAQPNVNTIPTYFDFNPITSHMLGNDWAGLGWPAPAQATGWDHTYPQYPSASRSQRAMTSCLFYSIPDYTWTAGTNWALPATPFACYYNAGAGWTYTDPSYANRIIIGPDTGTDMAYAESFDVYGFYWYHGGPARTWAGGWPTVNTWPGIDPYTGIQHDQGIMGSEDIPGWEGSGGGLYKVKVWAFDPWGNDGIFRVNTALPGLPPVWHGADDDWRMYQMAWPLENIEVPWGGAVEVFVTMNNMATLRGTVRWFDMYGDLRALPWAQITASPGPDFPVDPASGASAFSTGLGAVGAGASDPSGAYIMWLPAGSHSVSVSTSESPGVWTSSAPSDNTDFTVVVSDGWMGGGDTQLSTSGVPVPELPTAVVPLGLFAVLAASVWLLRRKNSNIPIVMK
jgi:hypothetical protein